MFSGARKKARAAMLEEAKRQMFRSQVVFTEDTRPVSSVKLLYSELNEELFEGLLPNVKVAMNGRLKRTLGKAYYIIESGGNGPRFWAKMKELGYPKTHTWPDALSCEKDIWS